MEHSEHGTVSIVILLLRFLQSRRCQRCELCENMYCKMASDNFSAGAMGVQLRTSICDDCGQWSALSLLRGKETCHLVICAGLARVAEAVI